MAVQLSYPGVYVQEVPSGVRTITGVARSITGFIGRTARGPVNVAVTINSFGDFERQFGGLAAFSSVGFAVRDFFLNGGGQAVIVRLYKAPSNNDTGQTTYDAGDLKLVARDPGSFGKAIRIAVDVDIAPGMDAALGLDKAKMFNLTVTDLNPGGASERYANLTVANHPRRVDRILEAQSALVRWRGAVPTTALAVARAKDAVSTAQDALDSARKAQPFVQGDVDTAKTALDAAIAGLAGSDGQDVGAPEFNPAGGEAGKLGLYAFEQVDLVNLLCIPPFKPSEDVASNLIALAAAYCERRRAFLILDPPLAWTSPNVVAAAMLTADPVGTRSDHAAVYFPRLSQPNPFRANAIESFPPCGRGRRRDREDRRRARHLEGTGRPRGDPRRRPRPQLPADRRRERAAQPARRQLPAREDPRRATSSDGARTMQGDDGLASEYKYIPVRRLALYIEESAYRGTQWAVFEPNDEPLWSQLRLNVGAFMHDLFRQGAFQGTTPKDAYFVKCDAETTTQSDINLGVVNVLVGFAPLKPAEFVVISLQPDGRKAGGLRRGEPWHSSPSTRAGSTPTGTSSSGSSGTAATWPASAR